MISRRRHFSYPEEKKAKAYRQEQLGEARYFKLKDDPNYAMMCNFCTEFPLMTANRIEKLVPEKGTFPKAGLFCENQMWAWTFDEIRLILRPGYRDEYHQMLYLEVDFGDDTDRTMSGLLKSGTKSEIIEYLRTPDFGPRLMSALDEFDMAIRNHDR